MIEGLEQLDRQLFLAINGLHANWASPFMWFLSYKATAVGFILFFSYFIYRKKGRKKTVEFLLGCLLVAATTDLSSNAIKHAVQRHRPTHNTEIAERVNVYRDYRGGKYGFLSGHATNTFGVVTFLFLAMHWVRVSKRLWLFLFAAAVAYSRIYLGVHYPSDVLAGTALGVFIGTIGFFIMNRSFLKFDVKNT